MDNCRRTAIDNQFNEISSMLQEIGGRGEGKMGDPTVKMVNQVMKPKPESPNSAGIDSVLSDPVEEWLKAQDAEIRKLIDIQRMAILKELRKSQEERERLQKERDYAV